MTNPRIWRLYLDESGDFSDPDAWCVVAGLLVGGDNGGFERARLTQALKKAAPGVPWPIHAWLTRRPAMHLLWGALPGGTRLSELPRGANEAERQAWDRARSRLAYGREPSYGDLKAIESAIHRLDAALGDRCEDAKKACRTGIRKVLAAAVEAGDVAIVLAGDRASDGTVDRYLDTLTALLERLADTLGRLGGSQRLAIRVLGRHVDDPRTRRRVDLRVGDVRRTVRQAFRAINAQHRDVQVEVEEVAKWDPDVHPGLVLADYVANAAAFESSREAPLGALKQTLEKILGARPTLSGMTLAASNGPPREVVIAARDGLLTAASEAARRMEDGRLSTWEREQAMEWVARHAGGAR